MVTATNIHDKNLMNYIEIHTDISEKDHNAKNHPHTNPPNYIKLVHVTQTTHKSLKSLYPEITKIRI